MKKIKLFFCFSILLLYRNLTAQSPPKEISQQELVQFYKSHYLSSRVDSINWSNTGQCDPGTISHETYKKAEDRINFFRLMNRLPLIKIVPDKKEEAQAAAFLMMQNNSLSHSPPSSWKCFSQKAGNGAASSCLGFFNFRSAKETTFITDYIRDAGDANYFVGHRRWLLSSQSKILSYGATKKTDAIFCMPENSTDTLKTGFIAYPWNGYVPYDLIFPKWSFAIPAIHKVDFSKMKMTIKDATGKNISFKLLNRNDGFPDHTIVWKMPEMFTAEEEKTFKNNLKEKGFIGKEITIKIENIIVNNKNKTYQYKVKITEL